jgi:LacI family transcriptional regulator
MAKSRKRDRLMARDNRGGRTTLKEVAQAAGVSVAAVSKVLNGRGQNIRVGDDRAEVIREVASRLRYHPNALASSLRMSRTDTVGLIWESMQSIADGPLYYVYLLDGVSRMLFARHYRLTILPELPEGDSVRRIGDGRLDGAIWCKMPSDDEFIEALSHSQFKIVGMNCPAAPNGEYVSVTCDNEGGSELVVDHLYRLGHRKILFALDQGWETAPDAHARLTGFKSAMAKRGLCVESGDVVVWQIKQPEVAEWFTTQTSHTAIFAWHDGLASAILKQSKTAGIRVPEDLSVAGFDSTVFCDSTTPRLTSVRQPIIEMAECAAILLLGLIEDAQVTPTHIFPCTLDVRNSTSFPCEERAFHSQAEDIYHEAIS